MCSCHNLSPLRFFKCLSEPTRLQCMLLIFKHHELCVCDLQESLNLSQPKISRHLADLRNCRLLEDERRGRWVYYRLHPDLPSWAKVILQQAATQENPC